MQGWILANLKEGIKPSFFTKTYCPQESYSMPSKWSKLKRAVMGAVTS
jgi:hypothetical protein